ncbi:helix-turn-helix domain-containing protein [Variovorax fucosicus]|uniref:helix-turn-helix domain-containing protein n=1 Tax=Variovorax fucosicus TaxID=3053517 RepID=UPI0025782288|nr:helix-turn-helix domain-containing protein [Variovorax sp. J22G47]MDM0058876.1 helix-turn-helix domain-containing protein [Variovorax sp. J22G47]
MGLSRARFFALFRDQLHTTPQVFWSGVHVEEAMRRVSEGSELTDVALDLGFSAPGNFSRFFKERTGVSPSIFKRATESDQPGGPIIFVRTAAPRQRSCARPCCRPQ